MLIPPESLRIKIGPFRDPIKYMETSFDWVQFLKHRYRLFKDDWMLEIGCGCGRQAGLLKLYLEHEGKYEGLDVNKEMILWCQENLGSQSFNFTWADVASNEWNPMGQDGATYTFPYPDEQFTYSMALSIYTHTFQEVTERYIQESSRVITKGGYNVITCFLLDAEIQKIIEKTNPARAFRYKVSDNMYVHDPSSPETGVAYTKEYFFDLLQRNGFEVVIYDPGSWSSCPTIDFTQDLLFLQRKKIW